MQDSLMPGAVSPLKRGIAAVRPAHLVSVALWMAIATSANAGLLEQGQSVREIQFSLGDVDKPMIEASVDGKKGRMLFDNGTPDALFLNRDALSLGNGKLVANGNAASGQAIQVQEHITPTIQIANQVVGLSERIRSGDFAFTAPAFGEDFLGFIGTKMVENDAFLLDYARRRLVVFKTDQSGSLPTESPNSADIVVTTRFLISPSGLPMFTTSIGSLPILTDIDTGDGGTFYVTAATRELLQAQGHLHLDGKKWRLSGLRITGVLFDSTPVRLVDAGGVEDFRKEGKLDQLRLGSAFLMSHTCLWNFPAKTLTFLKSDSEFLGRLSKQSR